MPRSWPKNLVLYFEPYAAKSGRIVQVCCCCLLGLGEYLVLHLHQFIYHYVVDCARSSGWVFWVLCVTVAGGTRACRSCSGSSEEEPRNYCHFICIKSYLHISRLAHTFCCWFLSFMMHGSNSSVEAWHPTQHITGHFGDDFYRPDDQTNSVKALKETSWLSRSGLNLTRITPLCYSNTTLGNCLYAQVKGLSVTNPVCWTCKNCSYECAADCEHCVTQSSTE